ncbi:MAG: hypothetical protein IBJ18_09960 [Phycisphaerales bacterium]|nr:hypothetical protein [Phycisphaerales bacterium]
MSSIKAPFTRSRSLGSSAEPDTPALPPDSPRTPLTAVMLRRPAHAFNPNSARRATRARLRRLATLLRACPRFAHEFNALLLTISAGVMVAKGSEHPDPITPSHNPALRRTLDLIDTAAQQARLMTRGMIRLSRCDHDPVRAVSLSDLLQETTALGRALLPAGITLRQHLAHQLPTFNLRQGELLACVLAYLELAGKRLPIPAVVNVSLTFNPRASEALLNLWCDLQPDNASTAAYALQTIEHRWDGDSPLPARWHTRGPTTFLPDVTIHIPAITTAEDPRPEIEE